MHISDPRAAVFGEPEPRRVVLVIYSFSNLFVQFSIINFILVFTQTPKNFGAYEFRWLYASQGGWKPPAGMCFTCGLKGEVALSATEGGLVRALHYYFYVPPLP